MKTILASLFITLIVGCRNSDQHYIGGYSIAEIDTDAINIKKEDFRLSLSSIKLKSGLQQTESIYLTDSAQLWITLSKDRTALCKVENNAIEGKLLVFDEYMVVKGISWFHNGQEFLTITPAAILTYSNFKNIIAGHIKKPIISFEKVSLERTKYHIEIIQPTYPLMLSRIDIKNKEGKAIKMQDLRDDLISNGRHFYIDSFDFPVAINIAYFKEPDTILKNYQWRSDSQVIIQKD